MIINRGVQPTKKKVVIYGAEGIGKTTIASKFPDPLFIDIEGSTSHFDVARTEVPTSWEMLKQILLEVQKAKPCKTLVIDTADWAEQLITKSVCAAHNWTAITQPGYGAGYPYVVNEFGAMLNKLDEIKNLGIDIVVLAHGTLSKFEQPDEMGAYDRWTLKLLDTPKCSNKRMLMEWADMVLFANYKTITVKGTNDKVKAQGGKRVMYTTHTPFWDAKNRFSLADELPFEYSSIEHLFKDDIKVEQPKVEEKAVSEMSDIEKMDKILEINKKIDELASDTVFDPDLELINKLPKPLGDLMIKNNVTTSELRNVVAKRGYFPADTDVTKYPNEFYNFLVSNWSTVHKMILDDRQPTLKINRDDLPF